MLQLCISNYYAIFFILLTFINNILCFNIEELKAINYEVDILQTPMKKEEPSIPVVHMTSIFGQEYQCILPHIEEEEVAEKITYSEKNADIKELLKPLHTGNCLLKAKDWWTYELCFGQYIKQFHIEDGQIIGQIITLGFYDSDYDWNNETDQEKFKHLKQRYHSQFYVNGTKCDLTGQPRVAEVKIYCEEDAGDYIYRVDEPGTCSYVIAVHTSRVCSHPQLKPLPSKKAHTIPCHPLLNERQFAKYQAKLNEETAVANEKRNQWLTNQQERLQVMKKDNPQTDKDDISAFNEFYKNVIKEIEADPELNYLSGTVKKVGGENSDSASKPEGSDFNTKKSAENYLFKEYDKELEKLKSFLTPENFAAVKNMLQERFQALLNEANENGKAEKKDDKNTANKLTSTLNSLLKMLDQAEKDVIEATKRISKTRSSTTASTTGESSNIAKNAEISELELGRKKSKVNDDKKKGLGNEEKKKILDEADNDDELQVLIRRLDKVRSSTRGYEIDQLQQKKLEKAIKENLEKSGINTGGRRIEVKIIKAGYYDNHLTDEEANQFQNMITALLTGEQETIQEIERNKKLEENYKFTWKTEPDEESDEN